MRTNQLEEVADDAMSLELKSVNKETEILQLKIKKMNKMIQKARQGKFSEISEIQKKPIILYNKKSILKMNFQTSKNPYALNMKPYPFEKPQFPDFIKPEVKQEILQEEIKSFTLTFISFIRNENDLKEVKGLVDSILKLDPNSKIFIGTSHDKVENFENKNVIFKEFSKLVTLGHMINTLLKESKTELGLILPPNSRVNERTDLKKIFGAFTHTDAVIVSGSNRDIDTGELYLPCYRIFLQRWTYQIEYGYSGTLYYKNESPVAICQRTELPMTFKLSKLKSNQFFDELITDDDLTIEEYYIKMSLHIKSVVTPHTMFHVRRKKVKSINIEKFTEKWMPLAKKYKFDNIIGYNGNENRIMLCREDWTLAFHHVYFMQQFLFTPTCNYRYYHLFFRYFFEFFKKRGIKVYLTGSGDNLGAYKFGSFIPWDADWDVNVDLDRSTFQNDYENILKKKFQIDHHYGHVNFKPTIWGNQFKDLGNDVLISAIFKKLPEKTKFSYVRMDGVLYPQIYNPFKAFMTHYRNSYLEHRLHNGFGGAKSDDSNCKPGKSFVDIWYDYGGKGTSKPNGSLKNHPSCVKAPKGSFFDNIPCPCNRLTHGLSSKNFE
eukprot:gene8046-12508_t